MTENNKVNAMYIAQNGSIDQYGSSITYSDPVVGGITGGGCKTNAFYSCTPWDYWQNFYYPQVIRESYPVYIRERAEDKGKQAFEIIKMLQDKKLIKFDKVSEFIEAMDALIKIL